MTEIFNTQTSIYRLISGFEIVTPESGTSKDWGNTFTTLNAISGKQLKLENFIAEPGRHYVVDTRSSPVTALLPFSPSIGDTIYFYDTFLNWDVNNFILSASSIIGAGNVIKCDLKGIYFSVTYIDETAGWNINTESLLGNININSNANLLEYLVPPGAVQAFLRLKPPPGWLACEGFTVPNGYGSVITSFGAVFADFSNLYKAVSNAFGISGYIPDLRGIFIRGLGSNEDVSGVNSGPPGVYQPSSVGFHNHTIPSNGTFSVRQGTGTFSPNLLVFAPDGGLTTIAGPIGETRPVNIPLLYCIKY